MVLLVLWGFERADYTTKNGWFAHSCLLVRCSQVHMTGGARGMLKLSFPTHLHPAPSAARLSYSVERRAQLNDKDTDDSPVVSQLWR